MASLLTCSSSAAALLLRNVARTALGAPATQREHRGRPGRVMKQSARGGNCREDSGSVPQGR